MLDTKGPEIRTGMLRDNKPVELIAGQELQIVTDYSIEGDNKKIACSYKNLPQTVSVGSTIFIADGTITCEVIEIFDVRNLTQILSFFREVSKLQLRMTLNLVRGKI